MRKEHMVKVEKWANFVKNNPDKWQKIQNEFINSQFKQHELFIKNLLKEKNGKEKLIRLFRIKNHKAYDVLN